MIVDLVNQIIVGVIPAEWKFHNIVNCQNGREGTLENGHYETLK